jgi:hypothetical protein
LVKDKNLKKEIGKSVEYYAIGGVFLGFDILFWILDNKNRAFSDTTKVLT